jgi:hypothetical protein
MANYFSSPLSNPIGNYFNKSGSSPKVDPIISKQQRLKAYGYDPTIKQKKSILEVLLEILPRGEAMGASLLGGALKGQDIGTTLSDVGQSFTGKKKYTAEDILSELGMKEGIGKKVAGFALGTAIDPLTYIPIGKVAKGATNIGRKVPGVKNIIGLGDDVVKAAKKAVGIKTFTSTGMKDLDTILKGASGGVNYSAKLSFEKYTPLFKGLMKTSDDQLKLVSRAMEKPERYLNKLDEAGLTLYTGLSSMLKETGETKQTLGIVKELIGGKKAKQLTEKGVKVGKKFLGLGGAEADSYLPHLITDDFRQKILDMGSSPEEAINTLRGLGRTNLAKTEKTRTLMGTIADLNRQAQKKYKTDIFETDLKKIIPKYLYNYSKNTALVDMNKELLKLTDNVGNPLIKQITGNVGEGMVKLTGLPYNGAYQASPEVAQQINKVTGVLTSDPTLNKFLKGFDKVQNVWKKGVTVINPTFHLNNLMGATFNNFIKDPKSLTPEVLDITQKILRDKTVEITAKNGKTISGKELLDYLNKRGALTNFISPEKAVKPGSVGEKVINRVGSGVENLVRTQLAVSQFKKTGNLTDVVRAVWEVHGNYNLSALSKVETDYVKRAAPFYIWAKTNIPFQIKNILNKTGKYSALARLQNQVVSPEERAKLPEWMRGSALMPIKTNADGSKSVSPLNLPIGDLNDLANPLSKLIGGRLSPAVKAPIEWATNKNLFYDSPIVDKNLPMSMQKAKAPEAASVLPEFMKKAIGYQEIPKVSEATGKETTKKEMNAQLAYLLNTFGGPTTRYANIPKNVNDELLAGGLDKNNITTIMAALKSIMSPVRPRSFDPKDQEFTNQKTKEAELQARINYLIQRGLIPKLK